MLASFGSSSLTPALRLILIGSSVGCLLMPRLLAWIDTTRDPVRRREHGGALRLLVSMLVETALSAWMAPLFLIHHAHTVIAIWSGRAVTWGAQNRDARTVTGALMRMELPTTFLGVGLALALRTWRPELLWWLAPLWLPALCSVPLALLMSSPILGRLARRLGLFLTGSEVEPHPLLVRARELRSMTVSHTAARFRDLVLDPVLLATHIQRLPKTQAIAVQQAESQLADAYARALRLGPAALSAAECALLASDAETLRRLHREAWRRWPVESWDLARLRPQTPPVPG
jgi:membrane glycosyltransferase